MHPEYLDNVREKEIQLNESNIVVFNHFKVKKF